MEANFYHIEELAEKSSTPIETITEWVSNGIVVPDGRASDTTPIFSEESLKTITKVKSLLELGYETGEVKKIIKKVGLPAENGETKKKTFDRNNYLTVGSLAEKIDASPRTIKHWEEKGIIQADLRSQGGFRLYRDYYIFLCNLIKDLQLFGYSLDEIKTISDYFRLFIELRDNPDSMPPEETDKNLELMENEIKNLFLKTEQLKNGIKRWEDLLKKQKKQITTLRERSRKLMKKGIDDAN